MREKTKLQRDGEEKEESTHRGMSRRREAKDRAAPEGRGERVLSRDG